MSHPALTPALPIPYDALAAFCQRHHVRKLMLFGSILRDDFNADSDVDVLVEFEQGAKVSYFDLGGMLLELEELFERKVDLGTPNMLSKYIKDKVLGSAQVIYER